MATDRICNQLAKQFNFENIEKLFESNTKIEKIAQYEGYYKFPFLTENVICVLNKNNLFVNYSKLHTTIGAGKFANKLVSAKFIGAFNQFLELCGEKQINKNDWQKAKTIQNCLELIDQKYYIHDPTLNPKSQISGVYLPLSFLHHFLNAFNIEYRAQVADMMNMIGLNALFSNDENKTTLQIVQTITNDNLEELTNQIKELQSKYIKENQQRVKYEIECKNINDKYNKYFEETEDYRRIANMYESENRRLLSIINSKNQEIEELKYNNGKLEERITKLNKALDKMCAEHCNYRANIKMEKEEEINEYKNTIKHTNEFISEVFQFIEPINKMIGSDNNKTKMNALIKFMNKNGLIMKKTYKVYNIDYESDNKEYLRKKAKYETQLEEIKNLDKLKEEMNECFINSFNELTEQQQLDLINEEEYKKSVDKARRNKKKIPPKHQFITESPINICSEYPEVFSKYYTLYNRVSNASRLNAEKIQQQLDKLYIPQEYTIHYPKKDIEYKMRNIKSYTSELRHIIEFIRNQTVYDESTDI